MPSPSPVTPTSSEAIASDATEPLEWARVVQVLAGAQTFWLATTRGGERPPHVRPVLAVAHGGSIWSTSSLAARKAHNLQHHPRSTISTSDDDIDLVVEAAVRRVTDAPTLEQIAAVYREKYGWPPVVQGDQYDAPYGAPTAGPPPYALFEHRPTAVWAFGTTEGYWSRATRFHF